MKKKTPNISGKVLKVSSIKHFRQITSFWYVMAH